MSSEIIWPWWVRLSHWLVALGIFLLWLLTYVYYETDAWHRGLGYAVLGLVLLRIVAACFTRVTAARLTLPRWQALSSHLVHLKQKQLPVVYGHNPLGQLAVYVIWALIALLGFTGWLSRTDQYWGEDWPVALHACLSYALMVMVALHLVAVYVVSRLSRQHLLKQMIDGKPH